MPVMNVVFRTRRQKYVITESTVEVVKEGIQLKDENYRSRNGISRLCGDQLHFPKAGMHNPRPAGLIRPPKDLYPALGAG